MADSPSIALPRTRGWSSTDLMMLMMTLIWGINYSVIKIALQSAPPFAFNVVRFILATLLMLIFLFRRGESLRLQRRDILPMIVLALAGHGIYQIFFISGLARTTPANSAMLLAAMPIFVAIYGQLFGVERANRYTWAGIVLSFCGIILLILGSGKEMSLGGSTMAGDLMSLFAAMLWAAYATISKPMLVRYSPVKVTTMQMLIGTPLLLLIGLPQAMQQNWTAMPSSFWLSVTYSAVLATVVGYVIWSTGVQRAGNTRTAIYSNVTPIMAAIAAWVILGEPLYPGQILGAIVVFAGLMLTRRGRRHG